MSTSSSAQTSTTHLLLFCTLFSPSKFEARPVAPKTRKCEVKKVILFFSLLLPQHLQGFTDPYQNPLCATRNAISGLVLLVSGQRTINDGVWLNLGIQQPQSRSL